VRCDRNAKITKTNPRHLPSDRHFSCVQLGLEGSHGGGEGSDRHDDGGGFSIAGSDLL
jgi:hypothetical protein